MVPRRGIEPLSTPLDRRASAASGLTRDEKESRSGPGCQAQTFASPFVLADYSDDRRRLWVRQLGAPWYWGQDSNLRSTALLSVPGLKVRRLAHLATPVC